MDHSVDYFQKSSKKQIKKTVDSNLRRKKSVAKSSILKYKKNKIKSRSQSKTITKCYPSKGHSVYKQNASKNKFSLFSYRDIDLKSKTPTINKKELSDNCFHPKFHTKNLTHRDISEKIKGKNAWHHNQISDSKKSKKVFEKSLKKNNIKDRNERQQTDLGLIKGWAF